jgi:succinoglycan biosynthesis transport protein ExoP
MALPQNFVTVTRRPPDIEDYIDMLRRYRSWIIGPMFAGLVISTVVAFLWKDTFMSVAIMRITPQQVSEKLVPAEFSTQMTQRLNAMEQEILSRTTLEGLIKSPALNLYQRDQTERPMEDIVQDMRNRDIHIQPIQMMQATGAPDGRALSTAFSISFTYPDRYKAQAVVRELVTRFTEQNVQVQRNQAHMTSEFLDDELRSSKEALNKIDDQITRFKIENQGKLPEEFNSNTAMLQSAQINLSNLSAELQRAMDMKATYETSLQSAMNQLTFYQENADDFVVSGAQQMSVGNQQLVQVSNQLTTAEQNLAGLQNSLGAKNPQITALKSEIEVLKSRKAQLEKEEAQKEPAPRQPDGPKKVPNKAAQNAILQAKAAIENFKTQIAEANDNIKRIQGLQETMKRNIATYEQRIQASPLNERQWAALQREHQLDQEAYDATVKKRQMAETSANLEEHKAGENLEVLDQASDPQQPIYPHRAEWTAIGTGLGLLLGLVLAGGKEMKNTSLKNLKDVRAYTNLPVLSSIPLLENALLVRRKRRLFWLAWISAFIFGSTAVLASMYYYYFGQK